MMRRRLSTRARLELFLGAHGRCKACDRLLTPGTRWEVDHVVPLALGGADTDENLQVLCSPCHAGKTATRDIPAIAKTERIKARHLGARRARRPMPGGRNSQWKRTIDGRVVERETTLRTER
jgi:5-methylcytosine-specific restriction endonuclease McrA